MTMAGYAARKDLSQGVHDPLGARAIAFELDGKRLVLVSADLVGFRTDVGDSIRKAASPPASSNHRNCSWRRSTRTADRTLATDSSSGGHANNVEYTKKLEVAIW